MRDRGSVRFTGFRLVWDAWIAFWKGWEYSPPVTSSRESGWHLQGQFPSVIRQRPELGSQNAHRIHNMRLACSKLNGHLLHPNQVFSLQRLLGPPRELDGYRAGPVLVGSKLVSSPGGGLCQISTALFNAALLAGLEILERHNHSSDPWGEDRAFPLGMDATYVHARLDLKFRNVLPFPVQLLASVTPEGDRLEMAFLAPLATSHRPEIQVRVLKRLDPPQEGWRPGWIVETCRLEQGRPSYRSVSRYVPTPIPGGAS